MYNERYGAGYGENQWFIGPPRNRPVITIIYARRFRIGKCILAALIPAGELTLGTLANEVCTLSKEGCCCPPIIMNGLGGPYLRLLYQLPNVRSDERGCMLGYARALAVWAREFFEMPTIISPIGGLIEARRRLDAF